MIGEKHIWWGSLGTSHRENQRMASVPADDGSYPHKVKCHVCCVFLLHHCNHLPDVDRLRSRPIKAVGQWMVSKIMPINAKDQQSIKMSSPCRHSAVWRMGRMMTVVKTNFEAHKWFNWDACEWRNVYRSILNHVVCFPLLEFNRSLEYRLRFLNTDMKWRKNIDYFYSRQNGSVFVFGLFQLFCKNMRSWPK